MTTKKNSTKRPAKGKAEGSKGKKAAALTPEQLEQIEAEAEAFKLQAHEYATKAYTAAVAHFEKYHNNPFALSRLAVVYDEQQPGDFNIVVTLPGSKRDKAISDGALHKWLSWVEIFCRTLEHPNCSDAFRSVFGAVFTDNILDGSSVSWTTPAVVRVMLPLALMEMVRGAWGEPEQWIAVFETLREELNDDVTAEEVSASVVGA